jgi:DNA (cytosine-5)-methyltransferase 1
MFTLTGQDQHGIFNGMQIRRLTPTECERLQGFPDGWTTYGIFGEEIKEISDSQRYKCLGNAVTTNVITEVIKRMF